MKFYATAAQVIPTLFIAMAFGGGILAVKSDPPTDPVVAERFAVASIYATMVMIFGEFCALFALATQSRRSSP